MRGILIGLVVVLLAGCLEPSDQHAPSASEPEGSQGAAQNDSQPGPPADAIVDAPLWRVGDWWRWRVESIDADPFEATTVVTGVEPGTYRVGVQGVAEALHGFADHVLQVGAIDRADFSWIVHDQPARIIRFPLQAGDTWDGEEQGRPLRFESIATSVDFEGRSIGAIQAVGRTDDEVGIRFTYAPELRQFFEYALYEGDDQPWATAFLIGHGEGAREAVDLDIHDLRWVSAYAPSPPYVPVPDADVTLEVGSDIDTIGLACWGQGDGHHRITLVSPSGLSYSCVHHAPSDGTNLTFRLTIAPAEPGTWMAKAVALPAGSVFGEVYGMVVSSVVLGSG